MLEGKAINPLEPRERRFIAPMLLALLLLGAFTAVAYFLMFRAEEEVPAQDWVSTESEEGGFVISMPGEPEPETREMEGAQGKVYLLTLQKRHRVYAVAWSDYAETELDALGADRLLDYAMEAGTEAISGTITRSLALQWQGHPGREFWADVPGGKAHYHLYLVGKRLYRLAIIHAPEFAANHDAFFSSFKLQ